MSDVQQSDSMAMTPEAVGARAPTQDVTSKLSEFERDDTSKPPFILTYPEVKLLGIAGVSVFVQCSQETVNDRFSLIFYLI